MARIWDVRKDARRSTILTTLASTLADLDRRPIMWDELDALARTLRDRAEAPALDAWHEGRAAGLREAVEALEAILRLHQ